MTLHAYNCYLRGKTIYSNYKLFFNQYIPEKRKSEIGKVIYYSEIKEVLNGRISNALILIDEVQIYLNSRNWEVLTNEVQYTLQQHRHDGLDIFGTTQHISRVDVVMRCLVQELFSVKNFLGKLFWWWSIDTDQLGTGSVENLQKQFGSFDWRGKKRLYDTNEKLNFPEKKTVIHEFRKCTECGMEKKIY